MGPSGILLYQKEGITFQGPSSHFKRSRRVERKFVKFFVDLVEIDGFEVRKRELGHDDIKTLLRGQYLEEHIVF